VWCRPQYLISFVEGGNPFFHLGTLDPARLFPRTFFPPIPPRSVNIHSVSLMVRYFRSPFPNKYFLLLTPFFLLFARCNPTQSFSLSLLHLMTLRLSFVFVVLPLTCPPSLFEDLFHLPPGGIEKVEENNHAFVSCTLPRLFSFFRRKARPYQGDVPDFSFTLFCPPPPTPQISGSLPFYFLF